MSASQNPTPRQWCKTISAEAEKVLAEYFGDRAQVERGHASYGDTDFSVKFTFNRPGEDGEIVTKGESDFRRNAEWVDLKADDFGATFVHGRTQYRITGWNSKARKFQISVERTKDGKRFKFPADVVKTALDRARSGDAAVAAVDQQVGGSA